MAIVSVALAHSCYTHLQNADIVSFFDRLARIGVFIFFFLAGYFFHPKQDFWKKKIIRLVIPWIIAATWMYSFPKILHHQPWSLYGYINYFLGNGTYLYFLTMLCCCYALCWNYKKWNKIIYLYIVANIISIILTACNILPQQVDAKRWFFSYLNPYLNIFNWIGIFSFGIVMQVENRLERVQNIFCKYWYLFLPMIVLLIFVANKLDINTYYWSYWALPLETLVTFLLLGISSLPPKNKYFIFIGKNTLPIYLYHFMLIGNLCFVPSSYILAIIRPFICVLICAILFYIGQIVLKKVSFKLEYFYNILLGLSQGELK
jgi:hypothetical protein